MCADSNSAAPVTVNALDGRRGGVGSVRARFAYVEHRK